ncbi:tRNA (guanine-N7-)-methyltransferase [Ereboglobus sp. PH5-5]|uniref:tRNA (guanine(46)-N(7))-methyltransferase TrmB n=1 Tax=Ereboglobus sp. PH5-5 TaxID=2940529 RepID=UPI0024072620|nr:SAM-dependent methyltransferase [Ereboglobus sp. PH5-5]MDF9832221.1 tRNA (guanine-N7-)-methyltransferase [Ereboglobus sp. PH5-5]
MENPVRTANFLAERDARIAALRETLGALLREQSRITLEIGCGHGHFLTAYAEAHPQAPFCAGLDLIGDRVRRANRKCERAALGGRLAFVQAEAVEFLSVLPEHVALADIFILFPDPWPKRRHHKHRIMRSEILDRLAERAEPGARLCFRTDDRDYFAAASEVVGEHPRWRLPDKDDPAATWPFEHATVFQQKADAHQSLVTLRA